MEHPKLTEHQEKWLTEPITMLNLDGRITNKLESAGIMTVLDLLKSCPSQSACEKCALDGKCKGAIRLMNIRQFGEKMIQSIYAVLEEIGFRKRNIKEENHLSISIHDDD